MYPVKTTIPKTLVIGGNNGRWSYSDKPQFGTVCNGIEAFVFAFKADYIGWKYLKEEDVSQYELIIANLNYLRQEYLKHAEILKKHNFSAKWVVLVEGDVYDYLAINESFRFILNNADFVNVINKHTESYFQAQTKKPCQYIGIPYPLEGIQKFTVPIEERNEQILLCSDPKKRNTDYLAASQLGLPLFGFTEIYSRNIQGITKNFKDNSSFFDKYIGVKQVQEFFTSPSIVVEQTVDLTQIFNKIASKKLWMNLDSRYTWGRYILDAATLGMPIISTESTGHASVLFPETTIPNAFMIDTAVDIGNKLLSDKGFYSAVSSYATEQLKNYGLEDIPNKLLTSIGF